MCPGAQTFLTREPNLSLVAEADLWKYGTDKVILLKPVVVTIIASAIVVTVILATSLLVQIPS